MAKGRMINNSICCDKRVNDLSNDTSRLAFTWLITLADCEGRTHGDAAVVKSMVFPRRTDISAEEMEEYIQEWYRAELIVLYEAKGDRYISFPNFEKNQQGLRKDREAPSILPAPDCPTNSGQTPEQIPVKLKEVKLTEEKLTEGATTSQNTPTNQAMMAVFDITGFTALPSRGREDAEYAIDSLWQRHPKREQLREYLRPYWNEWTKRQYNKSNLGWLDWAVTGEIPPPRKNGKEPAYKPTSPDIIAAGAEILRQARLAKGVESGK